MLPQVVYVSFKSLGEELKHPKIAQRIDSALRRVSWGESGIDDDAFQAEGSPVKPN